MTDGNCEIPKIIWVMWLQGFEDAPELVKKCCASWINNNPGWEVIFLDEVNLRDHIDLSGIIDINCQTIKRAVISDVARVNLLAKYGGVWADATCFCCRPLDDWLGRYIENGFFAFYKPAKDRLIDCWFMASSKNSFLTEKFCEAVNSYSKNSHFSNMNKKFIVKSLNKVLNRNTVITRFWFSFIVARLLQVYPYFFLPYIFAKLVHDDETFRKLWNEKEKFGAEIPIKLGRAALLNPITEQIRQDIDEKRDPVYKLTWKYDKNRYREGCILDYLLRTVIVGETADGIVGES